MSFFCENHAITRHIKYKLKALAPIKKSIMENKFSTNLERFLSRIKSPLTR